MDAQRLLASIVLACCRHLGQLLVSRVQSILCFWEGVPKPISKVYYITWLLQIRLQILSWSRKGLENTFTGTQQHEPRLLSCTTMSACIGSRLQHRHSWCARRCLRHKAFVAGHAASSRQKASLCEVLGPQTTDLH